VAAIRARGLKKSSSTRGRKRGETRGRGKESDAISWWRKEWRGVIVSRRKLKGKGKRAKGTVERETLGEGELSERGRIWTRKVRLKSRRRACAGLEQT